MWSSMYVQQVLCNASDVARWSRNEHQIYLLYKKKETRVPPVSRPTIWFASVASSASDCGSDHLVAVQGPAAQTTIKLFQAHFLQHSLLPISRCPLLTWLSGPSKLCVRACTCPHNPPRLFTAHWSDSATPPSSDGIPHSAALIDCIMVNGAAAKVRPVKREDFHPCLKMSCFYVCVITIYTKCLIYILSVHARECVFCVFYNPRGVSLCHQIRDSDQHAFEAGRTSVKLIVPLRLRPALFFWGNNLSAGIQGRAWEEEGTATICRSWEILWSSSDFLLWIWADAPDPPTSNRLGVFHRMRHQSKCNRFSPSICVFSPSFLHTRTLRHTRSSWSSETVAESRIDLPLGPYLLPSSLLTSSLIPCLSTPPFVILLLLLLLPPKLCWL